jgi:protein DEK
MSKITGRDELMEGLHNVLFRRKGQATTRKKGVLDFNGFSFATDAEEKELEARKTALGKWKLELIHRLMDVLDLQRGSGDKAAKVDKVIEFLQAPEKKSDVDLAAREAAKKEKEKKKRERAAVTKAKGGEGGEDGEEPKKPKRKSTEGKKAKPAPKASFSIIILDN